MAEGRRLKAGRWRICDSQGNPVRDPTTGGTIRSFESLADARHWWSERNPHDPLLLEAPRCAWCGAYFGPSAQPTIYGGRHYHPVHTPPAIAAGRGDSLDRS